MTSHPRSFIPKNIKLAQIKSSNQRFSTTKLAGQTDRRSNRRETLHPPTSTKPYPPSILCPAGEIKNRSQGSFLSVSPVVRRQWGVRARAQHPAHVFDKRRSKTRYFLRDKTIVWETTKTKTEKKSPLGPETRRSSYKPANHIKNPTSLPPSREKNIIRDGGRHGAWHQASSPLPAQ